MYEVRVRMFNYRPSFNGKHNATRCKAWLLLYDRLLGGKKGLTLRELALLSGIGYKSLSCFTYQVDKMAICRLQEHSKGQNLPDTQAW